MKRYIFIISALLIIVVLMVSCSTKQVEPEKTEEMIETEEKKSRIIGEGSDTNPDLKNTVTIDGLGVFEFEPNDITSIRDDIFNEGYFSIFDVLVYLGKTDQIKIDYYYNEEMNTYVISELGGHSSWWYDAYYDGGWRERSVFRMDHYPYKDKMTLSFVKTTIENLDDIYETYIDEVRRKEENGGRTIIPLVMVNGIRYENVEVFAHDLRSDMFKPGVITAIDTIMSLGDAGLISYDLWWYESIGSAGVVKSYWVNRIDDRETHGRCGFVYEAGNTRFRRGLGNHNHIPSDTRIINSPEYVEYFWICI